MPNRTIYIRNADVEKWDALKDKSEAISALLNEVDPSVDEVKSMIKTMGGSDEVSRGTTPIDIKAKEAPAVIKLNPDDYSGKWEFDPPKRTYRDVLKDINTLEPEIAKMKLDGADNQDPDYWERVQAKEAKKTKLWAEFHQLKGE